MRLMKLLAGTALLSGLMAAPAFAATYHYKLIAKIPLPAKPGHGDMVRYDPGNGYVYVSLTDGAAVVDTNTNKVIHSFPSISSPNDVAFDDNYVYWTEANGPGKPNDLVMISKKNWKIVGQVSMEGTSPDGMAIDPAAHKLYVMMDDNNAVDVYSTGETPKFQTKFTLYPAKGSGPDVGTLVASKNTLYMPDDAWEEAINTDTGAIIHKVDTKVKVTKKGGTKGQFYEPKTNRLWVGTSTSGGGMLVFNPTTLKVVKRLPEKGGVDQVSYDPKLGLMYAFEAKAKGFDVYDATTMKHLMFVSTGVGLTHTGDIDTKNDNVYAYAGDAGALYVYKTEK